MLLRRNKRQKVMAVPGFEPGSHRTAARGALPRLDRNGAALWRRPARTRTARADSRTSTAQRRGFAQERHHRSGRRVRDRKHAHVEQPVLTAQRRVVGLELVVLVHEHLHLLCVRLHHER